MAINTIPSFLVFILIKTVSYDKLDYGQKHIYHLPLYNWRIIMKKRICVLVLVLTVTFTLFGCQNSQNELDNYRQSVEEFYDEVIAVNDRINAIDAESDNAPQELLDELDTLNQLFQDFAELEVPKEYAAAESLADEAASFMNESVTLYHSSYTDGTFNEFSVGMAYDKYCRSILRINYIGDILQGKPIDDENINIYYEDSE